MSIWITRQQLKDIGAAERTIKRKTANGEWKTRDTGQRDRAGHAIREYDLASLPGELQVAYAARFVKAAPAPDALVATTAGDDTAERLNHLDQVARRLGEAPENLRRAWEMEALRRDRLLDVFGGIKPKTVRVSGKQYEFVPEVMALLPQFAATDPVILKHCPNEGEPPSAHTVYDWWRERPKRGLAVFLPSAKRGLVRSRTDARLAGVPDEVAAWLAEAWKSKPTVSQLWKQACTFARERGLAEPSYWWVYRWHRALPADQKVLHLKGRKSWRSRWAPSAKRNHTMLTALEVVSGDHSLRKVLVWDPEQNRLARPWLSAWTDVRTGLIWGWVLCRRPDAHSIAEAYFDGVRRWGAQPFEDEETGYFSAAQTDHGKSYKSLDFDGKVVEVHRMNLDRLEIVRDALRIGIWKELGVTHFTADPYSGQQKPVERYFRDMNDWERNTFDEFMGSGDEPRSDRFDALFKRHQKAIKRGEASPFITWNAYRERLAAWIDEYNHTAHERTTLGAEVVTVVPAEEFARLYTTRYEIPAKALTLLLSKVDQRMIRRNGVEFGNLSFFHPRMSAWYGKTIEVRHRDDDWSRVWCVLPDGEVVEAPVQQAVQIKPSKESMAAAAKEERREKEIRDAATELAYRGGRSLEERLVVNGGKAGVGGQGIGVGKKAEKPVVALKSRFQKVTPASAPPVEKHELPPPIVPTLVEELTREEIEYRRYQEELERDLWGDK